jgi:hypothetical protein
MTEAAAGRLAASPMVRYIEQNHTVTATGTQSPVPSWGVPRGAPTPPGTVSTPTATGTAHTLPGLSAAPVTV